MTMIFNKSFIANMLIVLCYFLILLFHFWNVSGGDIAMFICFFIIVALHLITMTGIYLRFFDKKRFWKAFAGLISVVLFPSLLSRVLITIRQILFVHASSRYQFHIRQMSPHAQVSPRWMLLAPNCLGIPHYTS